MTSVFWNSARAVLMFAALVAVAPVPGDALAATPNAADSVIAAASVDRGLLAPSVSYAVVRNGALADGVAHGFADVEHNVPATPATRYAIGSITKMVTATAVMQLVSAGRLKLTDHLDTYLPWYQHADRITIEQLLQHMSGVHDYIDDIAADVRSGKAPPPPATARDLIDR